jgi:hypothetical protein
LEEILMGEIRITDEALKYIFLENFNSMTDNAATEFQEEICDAFLYEKNDDEPETPEQKQERFEHVEKLKKMSPKEFWLWLRNRTSKIEE